MRVQPFANNNHYWYIEDTLKQLVSIFHDFRNSKPPVPFPVSGLSSIHVSIFSSFQDLSDNNFSDRCSVRKKMLSKIWDMFVTTHKRIVRKCSFFSSKTWRKRTVCFFLGNWFQLVHFKFHSYRNLIFLQTHRKFILYFSKVVSILLASFKY